MDGMSYTIFRNGSLLFFCLNGPILVTTRTLADLAIHSLQLVIFTVFYANVAFPICQNGSMSGKVGIYGGVQINDDPFSSMNA